MERQRVNPLLGLIKGAGLTFIGLLATAFFGFIFRVEIARMLGPEEYGIMSLVIVVFSVAVSFVDFGIPSAVTRYISYYHAKNDKTGESAVIGTGIRFGLIAGILIATLIFFSSETIATLFSRPDLAPLIRLMSISIPFVALLNQQIAVFIAYKRLEYKILTRNVLEGLLKSTTTPIFLLMGFGITGALLGFMTGWIIPVFISTYFFLKLIPPKRLFTKLQIRKVITFSIPLTISSVMAQTIAWTDVTLIGVLMGPIAVGIYNTALPTATYLLIFSGAITSLALPVFSQLYARHDRWTLNNTYTTVNKWIAVVTAPLLALVLFFPNAIIHTVFGPEYLVNKVIIGAATYYESSIALMLLSIGFFANAALGPFSAIVQAVNRPYYLTRATAVIAISNLSLNLLLIPKYGIIGAATATAASFIIGTIYILSLLKSLEIPFFKARMTKIFPAAIGAAAPLALVQLFVSNPPLILILLSLVLSAILYPALLLLFRVVDEDDVSILHAIEKKTGVPLTPLRNLLLSRIQHD